MSSASERGFALVAGRAEAQESGEARGACVICGLVLKAEKRLDKLEKMAIFGVLCFIQSRTNQELEVRW